MSARSSISPPTAHAPSWYVATAGDAPDAPSLAGERRTEVAVVGGGFTGLGAALRLAERGVPAMLLEAGPLGAGASGRNGGQVHVGMRREQAWLERKVGADDARALWRLAIDARDHLDTLVADHGITCDLQTGYLHADHRRRTLPDTRANVALLNERYGYDAIRMVEADEMHALVASDGYHGGSLDARGGQLHPLKLVHGLARAAIAGGARLHAGTPVRSIDRVAGGWRLRTPAGSVTARQVVLACNGYLGDLEPRVAARVMPINNFIAVTEPLGRERAEALIRGGLAVSDSRFVVLYFRMTPDHRLLFGGGESYGWRFPAEIGAAVRPHLAKVFPQLGRIGFDFAWGGTLAITPTRMPFVREVEMGLYSAGGFSGLGVVLAPYAGRILGDAIAGERGNLELLARVPVPRFPGGAWLRWPTLVTAMSLAALRDRL